MWHRRPEACKGPRAGAQRGGAGDRPGFACELQQGEEAGKGVLGAPALRVIVPLCVKCHCGCRAATAAWARMSGGHSPLNLWLDF